jgi:hypothetical protein
MVNVATIAAVIVVPVSTRATFGACSSLQHNPEIVLGMALSADARLAASVPPSLAGVSQAAVAAAEASSDDTQAAAAAATRVASWLVKNPRELKKAKTNAAALKVLAPLCTEKISLRPKFPEAVAAQVVAILEHMVDTAINAADGVPGISFVAGPQDLESVLYDRVVAALRTLEAAAMKARAARDAAAEWVAAAEAQGRALRSRMVQCRAEARAARNLRAARRVACAAVEKGSALEPRRVGPSRGALQEQARHRRAKQQRRMLNLERGKSVTKPKRQNAARRRDRDEKAVDRNTFFDLS